MKPCRYGLVLLSLSLALWGCSDAANNDSSAAMARPAELVVHFPAPRARYLLDSISVHGVVQGANPERVAISVDGGAGPVAATLDSDGRWIARDVALPKGAPSTDITLTATDNRGWHIERSISTLERATAPAQPIGLARRVAGAGFILGFRNALHEYDGSGALLHRHTITGPPLGQQSALRTWNATGEVVALAVNSQGRCSIVAYAVAAGSERILLQPDQQDPQGRERSGCNGIQYALQGEHLYLADFFQRTFSLISSSASVEAQLALDASLVAPGVLLADAGHGAALAFVEVNDTDSSRPAGATTVSFLEPTQGGVVDVFVGRERPLFDDLPPLAAANDNLILYWSNASAVVFDRVNREERLVPPQGLIPTEVIDVSATADSGFYLLDARGGVYRFDPSSGNIRSIYQADAYQLPQILLTDKSTADGSVLLYTAHMQEKLLSVPLFNRATNLMSSWLNLAAFNLETLEGRQIVASSNAANGLGPSTALRDSAQSIEPAPDGSLQHIDHRTGARTALDFPDRTWLARNGGWQERNAAVIDPQGRFIVIKSRGGIFEFSLSSGTLVRSMGYSGLSDPAINYRVIARGAGENANVYLVDQPLTAIYRVDFAARQVLEVSGPERGAGPLLDGATFNPVMSWSTATDSTFVVATESDAVLHVDLVSGDRTNVFSMRAVPGTPGGAATSVSSLRFLPERNALLAFGDHRLHYLDLLTRTALHLPLSPVD